MAAGKFGIGDLAAMGLANVGIGPLNVGNVLDTVEFVKKAWTSFGVPSNFVPTVDLGELDKRITDLKAVEQWLIVNMNMLQGTIQALEIQRGTIATLKTFGEMVGTPVTAAGPVTQAIATQALASALATAGGQSADGSPELAVAPARVAAAEPRAARATRAADARKLAPAGTSTQGSALDPGLSPSAWWNLLQNQFNSVAEAALSGVGLPKIHSVDARTEAAAEKPAGAASRVKARRPPGTKRAAGRGKTTSRGARKD